MLSELMKYKDILKHLLPKPFRKHVKEWMFYRWVRTLDRSMTPGKGFLWGVNAYGMINDDCGLAQAGRGNIIGFKEAGVPVAAIDYKETGRDAPYAINYFHLNPDLLPDLALRITDEIWKSRYNIGFWVWEQETIPEKWKRCEKLFDEIWTASEFSASAIRKCIDLPVNVVPHIVVPQFDESWNRKRWGLPESMFLVLIAFDCESVPERKNPLGAVRAFCKAFRPEEPVGLVIKVRNMTDDLQEKIIQETYGRDKVFFLTEEYPKYAVNNLIRICDVYLSLHRGEGFGLIIAEAMYLGTPVVATNWSGNTDYMDSETALPVEYELVKLSFDYPPFKKGSRWAEPDENQAAGYLRALYGESELYSTVAKKAAKRIREQLSLEAVSTIIQKRMENVKECLQKRD